DLFWALERMKRRFGHLTEKTSDLAKIKLGMAEEAQRIHLEKRATDESIGRFGAEFMPREGQVMTQCNAGALATGGIGTALGVIRVAFEQGRKLHVLVPETRPYLQGARLTAWELHKGGIPLTLITDNMVGHFLKTGKVGAIVTGADRIAANGDTANKIGTYQMAVLAKENGVPFYIAAPVSTFDLSIPDGEHIPIEERSAAEVTHLQGVTSAADRSSMGICSPSGMDRSKVETGASIFPSRNGRLQRSPLVSATSAADRSSMGICSPSGMDRSKVETGRLQRSRTYKGCASHPTCRR